MDETLQHALKVFYWLVVARDLGVIVTQSAYIKSDVIPKFIRSTSHSGACNKLTKTGKIASVEWAFVKRDLTFPG